MLELKVQPKKKSSLVPWILLVLGIVSLAWYILVHSPGDGKHKAAANLSVTSGLAFYRKINANTAFAYQKLLNSLDDKLLVGGGC